MTTTQKSRVKKPHAEIVGSFADVMKRGKCTDGRSLFKFCNGADEWYETFILASSELQAWKAMQSELGTIERMTRGKMDDKQREELLKLIEERDGEPQETKAGE